MNFHVAQIPTWTDLAIVLCKLKKPPSMLNTFVAHGVAAIQQFILPAQCHHVQFIENPADFLSRILKAPLLVTNILVWHDPCGSRMLHLSGLQDVADQKPR